MNENMKTNSNVNLGANSNLSENVFGYKRWTIRKYNSSEDFQMDNPYEVSEFEGNVLLNEGITALQNLLTGETEDAFNEANSWLGVGDSSVTASATASGLLGTNAYASMSAGYPQISGQTTTWRAVFGSGSANFDWREFTVANSSSNAGDNLNRKVSNQGTKAAGQTWTLDLDITFS